MGATQQQREEASSDERYLLSSDERYLSSLNYDFGIKNSGHFTRNLSKNLPRCRIGFYQAKPHLGENDLSSSSS